MNGATAMSPGTWQRATSDVRGDSEEGVRSEDVGQGVASHNYFKPGECQLASKFHSV